MYIDEKVNSSLSVSPKTGAYVVLIIIYAKKSLKD